MAKPVVKVIPAQEAITHFRNAVNSEGAFEKARRFASGDTPKLIENHVEITHTATLQMPYTMRKLFANNGEGIKGTLLSALKKGTEIKHSSLMNQVNPKGYLCEAFVSMGGMTGPCNVLFALDAINQTNIMVLKTHHQGGTGTNIDRLIEVSRSGQASQWNAQASAISSFRDPRTNQLLSTQMMKPTTKQAEPSASSSSSSMGDDEQALLEMQEMVGNMSVADGIEFPAPKHLFQGKSKLRSSYDMFGAVNPKTLDVCAYKVKRNDDYAYVLAHSVLGLAIPSNPCTLAYQGKEEVLPRDEMGYVLKVPNHLLQRARQSVLKKASNWENMTAHALEDMHVRIRPGVMNWRLVKEGESEYFERDGLRVGADEPFVLNMRLELVMRHYNSEGCAAIRPNFIHFWPQPVFNSRDVNFKNGDVRKDAKSMTTAIHSELEHSEDQLELLSQLTDKQVLDALNKAGVEIDEEGKVVPVASASSSSPDTSGVEDD